jgi:hypothetical protein
VSPIDGQHEPRITPTGDIRGTKTRLSKRFI